MQKFKQHGLSPQPALEQAVIPDAFAASSLSEQLRNLEPEKQFVFHIDSDGAHKLTGIKEAGSKNCSATVSFCTSGEMEITDGRPSLNGVRIDGVRLTNTHVFREGILIELSKEAETKILLPRDEINLELAKVPKEIYADLHALKVGETLSIGRSQYDLPIYVSRKHLLVERLENNPETQQRMYLVHDGFPSEKGVYLKDGEQWQRLRGSTILAPGRFFAFSDPSKDPAAVILEVPEPKKLLREAAVEDGILRTRIFQLDSHSMEALVGQQEKDSGAAHTMHMPSVNPATIIGNVAELKRVRDVGIQLRNGLRLIANQEYSQAMQLFSDVSVLQKCFPQYDFQFSPGRCFIINTLDLDQVVNIIQLTAANSWFKSSGTVKTISPSFAAIDRSVEPKNEAEEKIIQNFNREIALIYAEEFTHAYQLALCRSVSRHGIFLNNDHEADVAQLFRDYQVPMSNLFLSRYGRDASIERINGIQTKGEQVQAKNQLALLAPGEKLYIGWALDRDIDVSQKLIFATKNFTVELKPSEELVGSELNLVRANLRREVMAKPQGVIVSRLSDGRYDIQPLSNTTLYAPDAYGIWDQVRDKSLQTHAGKFRIGKHCELILP